MLKNIFLILLIIAALVGITAYLDQDVKNWVLKSIGQEQSTSKVYKWRDNNGVWQITSIPPSAGTPYTEQEYLHNTNIVPALPETE